MAVPMITGEIEAKRVLGRAAKSQILDLDIRVLVKLGWYFKRSVAGILTFES
jgi:hypothetical protein